MNRILPLIAALLLTMGTAWGQSGKTSQPLGDNDEVFVAVEQDPVFPGGIDGLMAFLRQNIKYPQNARENGVQGRVFVTFVIEKDGRVSNARVLRDPDPSGELGAEALRVVNDMPKWKPGKVQGRKVRVQFTLPVQFSLK